MADTRRHDQTEIPQALNDQEWLAVAHLRHWCHDSTKCPLCNAWDTYAQEKIRADRAERTLNQIISG